MTSIAPDTGRFALPPIYTIGHSRHPAEVFLALLGRHAIARLVDVRSHPASRWAPHFGKATLARILATAAIDYRFLGGPLGGRPDGAVFYTADGALDVLRRAEAPDFQAGIDELLSLARETPTVVLCAEEDPSRCHRKRLVASALRQRGRAVVHIRGDGRLEPDAPTGLAPAQLPLFR